MGKVYEAVWRENKEKVAVKFLHKSLQRDGFFVGRFLEEANLVEGFRHPRIVRTHGFGCTRAGVFFIVMDLVSGSSLAEQKVPIAWRLASTWLIEIAGALSHAHEAGVVHCDLKPANVLITSAGMPMLLDFGLAQRPETVADRIGTIAGTAPWMAPEQVDPYFGAITAQTDVCGLGALMYTLLVGMPPYRDTRTSDILSRLLSADMPSFDTQKIISLPEGIEQLCLKCLSKTAAERPKSVDAVAVELKRIMETG